MEPMTEAEKVVSEKLAAAGWKILTRGWPDFLCLKRVPNKPERVQVMCVEVKAGRDWLSEDQAIVHTFLKRAGLPCYTIKAEEVEKFEVSKATKKTVSFIGSPDVPESAIMNNDLDARGVPLINRIAELERKLERANKKLAEHELSMLRGPDGTTTSSELKNITTTQ